MLLIVLAVSFGLLAVLTTWFVAYTLTGPGQSPGYSRFVGSLAGATGLVPGLLGLAFAVHTHIPEFIGAFIILCIIGMGIGSVTGEHAGDRRTMQNR